MAKKPPLSLFGPDATGLEPPFSLGKFGSALWRRIQAEYDVSNSAGVEVLAQACAGADLAASARLMTDGAMVPTEEFG